jgi:cysteinyl-tRNA synthetase
MIFILGAMIALAQGEGDPPSRPLPLSDVRFWAYQLQHLEEDGAVSAMVSSSYDLLVLEPTRTHREEAGFDTRRMVDRLKHSPSSERTHRKLVLAYIDIGEAEDWRWYWTWTKSWKKGDARPADWPPFIVAHDPDGWSGNYPVAFWDEKWKDLVIRGKPPASTPGRDFVSVLDEVLRDGFDGVYLDWVDAWEQKEVQAAAKKSGRDPAKEMIQFIGEIRAAGRARNPEFLVIQQNGSGLLKGRPELLKAVDGIAQEDVWYSGDADVDWDNPKGYDRTQEEDVSKRFREELLEFKRAGKPVFTVDYTVKHAVDVYSRSRELGFVPYCSRTSLQQLTTTPPPGLQEKK